MGVRYAVSEQTKDPSLSVEKGLSSFSASIGCYSVSSRRVSVLPALLLDGILAVKIVEGSFTTALFKDFIDGLLDHMNPFPGPNSVIVMDNCRIHRAQSIRDMIEERSVIQHYRFPTADRCSRGMMCEFLPSYSPDFNPIELAFSKFKLHIRRNQHVLISITVNDDDDNKACILFLHDAVWSVTPEDAEGYFRHCSYC